MHRCLKLAVVAAAAAAAALTSAATPVEPSPSSPPPPPPPPPPLAGCDGTNYRSCRAGLAAAVFGGAPGQLPTTADPDFVEDLSETYEMSGLPGPGRGTGVGGARWKIGLKKLVRTLDRRTAPPSPVLRRRLSGSPRNRASPLPGPRDNDITTEQCYLSQH